MTKELRLWLYKEFYKQKEYFRFGDFLESFDFFYEEEHVS